MTTSTLTDALSSVARRNTYNAAQTQQLTPALDLALAHIPSEVRDDPTFCIALRGQGHYISINCMNSLLFRIPAYQDGGGPTSYDFISLPSRRMRWPKLSLQTPIALPLSSNCFTRLTLGCCSMSCSRSRQISGQPSPMRAVPRSLRPARGGGDRTSCCPGFKVISTHPLFLE